MTKKLLIIPAAALLAASAAATAQAALGGPPPVDPAPVASLEVPTALEDWCSFMAVAVGPGAAVPSVRTAVDDSLAGGEATAELAYVSQLGGIPAEVEAPAAVLFAALEALVAGEPVAEPAAAVAAADSVDAFRLTACGG